MSPTFRLKKLLFTVIFFTSTFTAVPMAMAEDTGGTFDMTSLTAQAQSSSANTGLVAAATGEQVSPQTQQQNYVPSPSNRTTNQGLNIAVATRTILSQGGSQSLPVTNLDSFVYQSGMSESIYGDEGTSGLPPFFGMDESHTIGSGISSGGLTTGHASNLPSAWCSYY